MARAASQSGEEMAGAEQSPEDWKDLEAESGENREISLGEGPDREVGGLRAQCLQGWLESRTHALTSVGLYVWLQTGDLLPFCPCLLPCRMGYACSLWASTSQSRKHQLCA